MNKTKESWNSILWVEAFGFSLLILLSWLTEVMRIPISFLANRLPPTGIGPRFGLW